MCPSQWRVPLDHPVFRECYATLPLKASNCVVDFCTASSSPCAAMIPGVLPLERSISSVRYSTWPFRVIFRRTTLANVVEEHVCFRHQPFCRNPLRAQLGCRQDLVVRARTQGQNEPKRKGYDGLEHDSEMQECTPAFAGYSLTLGCGLITGKQEVIPR